MDTLRRYKKHVFNTLAIKINGSGGPRPHIRLIREKDGKLNLDQLLSKLAPPSEKEIESKSGEPEPDVSEEKQLEIKEKPALDPPKKDSSTPLVLPINLKTSVHLNK